MISKFYSNTTQNLACFTLAKFTGAIVTIIIIAGLKYLISGSLHIDYSDFWGNIVIGLSTWTLNTGFKAWFTEYYDIKGINYNLKQIFFGLDTIKMGDGPSIEDTKPKLYNAMNQEDSSSEKGSQNKGGRSKKDSRVHPYPRNGRRLVRSWVFDEDSGSDTDTIKAKSDTGSGSDTETESEQKKKKVFVKKADKGKEIASVTNDPLNKDKTIASTIDDSINKSIGPITEPPFATWYRVFPGLDPLSVFFPARINPGPGFNVPGGEVPLHDDICKHIDYNSHILKQFKTMDLATAIQQKDGYLMFINVINSKIAYAQNALAKVPTIPTTQYEFNLKNTILRDLEKLNRDKLRSEAKATLLNSRIQFIEAKTNNKN